MMTLAMTVMFFVTSSQNKGCSKNQEHQTGKGRHHFRPLDCSVWTAVVREEDEEKGGSQRFLSNVTCFGCGKKAHVITHCLDKDKDEDKPQEKRDNNPKFGKEPEKGEKSTSKKRRRSTFIQQCRVVDY